MNVLVVGGGGREHALVWKLKQNSEITKLYCAPGNGGIAELAECVPIKATDLSGLCAFAKEKDIQYVVVGPDDPLALGLVDMLAAAGIPAFGPTQAAARIEASKTFAKKLMQNNHIPTARFAAFTSSEAACAYVDSQSFPLVIKADGLALGKGVYITFSPAEAKEAVAEIMEQKRFGSAGEQIVIEEFLTGPEVSLLAFCDGKTILPMVTAQDHKRIYNNDQGPNTGGMGAVCPAPHYEARLNEQIFNTVLYPTVEAMQREGCPFKGVLYTGLILTPQGPRVLEYNARFGDPETQSILPLLKTDLLTVLRAVTSGTLHNLRLEWEPLCSAGVVMASGGYPGAYQSGLPVNITNPPADVFYFHAGTALQGNKLVTAGGRVLCAVGLGANLQEALQKAYAGVKAVNFEGMQYRTDIGLR